MASWRIMLLGPALLVAAAFAPGPRPEGALAGDESRELDRARAAWACLTPAEQQDAVAYLRLECEHLGTFQQGLVGYARGLLEQHPSLFPEPAPIAWYDPTVHAPAQPIPRRLLPATDASVRELQRAVAAKAPDAPARRAWSYDPATRTLRRASDWDAPARVFDNALLGAPPDHDLAEAVIERALDDGAQQTTLAAFAHAYTDRAGGVHPGLTLYDAWTSGAEIEMPDVDTLGIVHDVLGDWKRWVAPVTRQQSLYDTLGELFQKAHHHRGLRRALARAWLEGDAVLRDGYQGALDNLHALWESSSSDPKSLSVKLPKAEAWSAFLEDWAKTVRADPELWQRAVHRHATLARDAQAVSATARRVLDEFGAYARLAAATKEKAPTPR
ncbi:MAG: hypothetical protein IPJ77_17525 [Planctomycetes bacterium]|nr:hypothetical protein [Planctomycetota bacterium]